MSECQSLYVYLLCMPVHILLATLYVWNIKREEKKQSEDISSQVIPQSTLKYDICYDNNQFDKAFATKN